MILHSLVLAVVGTFLHQLDQMAQWDYLISGKLSHLILNFVHSVFFYNNGVWIIDFNFLEIWSILQYFMKSQNNNHF